MNVEEEMGVREGKGRRKLGSGRKWMRRKKWVSGREKKRKVVKRVKGREGEKKMSEWVRKGEKRGVGERVREGRKEEK